MWHRMSVPEKARVWSQTTSCWICGGNSGNGTGILPNRFWSASIHQFSILSHSYIRNYMLYSFVHSSFIHSFIHFIHSFHSFISFIHFIHSSPTPGLGICSFSYCRFNAVTCLTLRRLMSYIYIYIYIYIYGAPILDVSRSHTTTQHSR